MAKFNEKGLSGLEKFQRAGFEWVRHEGVLSFGSVEYAVILANSRGDAKVILTIDEYKKAVDMLAKGK